MICTNRLVQRCGTDSWRAFVLPVGREASITSLGSPSFCPHPLGSEICGIQQPSVLATYPAEY